jgi:SSS family solute:Na+ symporter
MHINLTPIDWIILAVYLVGCMSAGIWMRRFVKGVEDFAIAGRVVNTYLGIASLAATEMGLVTVMYTAQLGFEKGFAGATIGVIMAAAMFFVGWSGFVIARLRRAGVMTIPELFEKRFGKKVRWLAGFFVAAGGLLNMGIFLRLGGDFLVGATGMPTEYLRVVMTVLLVLVLLYTVLGGMLSVLMTDYLQFLIVGLGVVVTSVLVIHDIGWSNLVNGLWSAHTDANSAVSLAAHPFNPVDKSCFGWGYVLWQIAFQIAVVTTWQTTISRVLATKDETTARRVYMRTAFYFVGRFGLPGLWGAGALVYFANHGGLPKGLDSMTAMPAYLNHLLPAGLLGLVIAAMIAAEMSTVSGYMLTWATVIYNDLLVPCLKTPLTREANLFITRGIVFAIGVFLLFFGLWYKLPGNAWDFLAVTGTIYLASVFTLLVAGLYWRGASSAGAIAALVLGAIGPTTFLIVNANVPKDQQIPAALAGAASFGLAFLGMIVGSLLAPNRNETEAAHA